MTHDQIIEWLLEGDAAIRWQTLRDLLDAPEQEWQAELRKRLERARSRLAEALDRLTTFPIEHEVNHV